MGPALGSEELCQFASASQQVRLQKVLWQEGPLRGEMLSLADIKMEFMMCSAHVEQRLKTTDDIYEENYEFCFEMFCINPFKD